MGQPKVIVAIVLAVVLAIAGFVAIGPIAGVAVIVIGGAGVFFLIRQEGATLERPGRARDDDDFLEADDDTRPAGGASDGLPSWDASADTDAPTLSTWQPTADAEPLGTWEPEPAGEGLGTWDPTAATDEGTSDLGGGLGTWEPEAETISLDEPVVDEAEEIALASSLVSSPINEDVASADDIMAASQATEVHFDDGEADSGSDGDNSELARLLAKVQERLAAYE